MYNLKCITYLTLICVQFSVFVGQCLKKHVERDSSRKRQMSFSKRLLADSEASRSRGFVEKLNSQQ